MKKTLTVAAALLAIGLAMWWLRGCQETAIEASHDDHASHGHSGAGAGHSSKHHKDPGPRLLSVAARLAERAAEARAIDWPDPAIGLEEYKTADDQTYVVIQHPDWRDPELTMREWQFFGPAQPRLRPDVLSILDIVTKRPDLEKVHAMADHDEHHACAISLHDRSDAARSKRLEFNLILHLTARAGKLVVDDVEPHGVPPEVDAEALACYVSMFRGHEVPDWPRDEQLSMSWYVCINPPASVAATN